MGTDEEKQAQPPEQAAEPAPEQQQEPPSLDEWVQGIIPKLAEMFETRLERKPELAIVYVADQQHYLRASNPPLGLGAICVLVHMEVEMLIHQAKERGEQPANSLIDFSVRIEQFLDWLDDDIKRQDTQSQVYEH